MLKEKIEQDLKNALKKGSRSELSVLRMLKADILNREKEKRYALSKQGLPEKELDEKSSLSEEELLDVVVSKAKKSRESIVEFEKGNRTDLIEKEKKELEVLKKYMPEQLGEEEIRKMAEKAIEKAGAKSIKDMGKVMSELMPQLKGKADGSLVSKVIREMLS